MNKSLQKLFKAKWNGEKSFPSIPSLSPSPIDWSDHPQHYPSPSNETASTIRLLRSCIINPRSCILVLCVRGLLLVHYLQFMGSFSRICISKDSNNFKELFRHMMDVESSYALLNPILQHNFKVQKEENIYMKNGENKKMKSKRE